MALGKKSKQVKKNRRLMSESLEPRVVLTANTLTSGAEYWVTHEQIPASNTGAVSYLDLDSYESFSVDVDDLRSALSVAPMEFTADASQPMTFEIPTPSGGSETFAVVESPIMAPELAAQFPEIKTYAGQSLDNPGSVVRFDVTPHGFHAQVRTADGTGGYYVDPYYHLENEVHVSYHREALAPRDQPFHEQLFDANGELIYSEVINLADGTHVHPDGTVHSNADHMHLEDDFHSQLFGGEHSHEDGHVHDHNHSHDGDGEHLHNKDDENCCCPDCIGLTPEQPTDLTDNNDDPQIDLIPRTGSELRIYRTAVAATGEYTQFHGGTVAGGQAAIVTMMNRVTGVYEDELTVRMTLVPNNSDIVYTNPGSDPFPNNISLNTIQNVINANIGFANYDLGHLVDTGGGGFAGLGVIGTSQKAFGYTGLTPPVNDPFWIDFVAHELGHQYGGNHTFNGDSGSCAGGNRAGNSAYEPGSGSTIMAYAGICGNDNLQNNSDAYFHSRSLDEIINLLDGPRSGVGTRVATGNSIPTADAGSNFTIPPDTPFVLTGSGTDADGDTLTYNWEQRDLGPQRDVNAPDNGSSPLFRSWEPNTDPTRTLPRLSDLVRNRTVRGEQLPTTNRILDFRLTVRDNRADGGAVATDDTRISVTTAADPFRVTVPNTSSTVWEQNSTETVTWDVAGTTGNGIDTATVNILLSLDGGFTYPITLAANTPNDGSQDIVVPNELTTEARVKVEAVGNIFFDISDSDFDIDVPSDMEAPTAVATAADITTEGIPSNLVTVVYSDNEGIDASDTGPGDIEFVAPDGTVTPGIFLSTSSATDTTPITVTYVYAAPGGTFDADDLGTHDIVMVANEITDVNDIPVAAGVIGSFEVSFETMTVDGDFDNDGDYDCDDINSLTTEVGAGTNDSQFDLNDDGAVDTNDITAWLAEAGENNLGEGLSYNMGDANLDGFVDGSDFNTWNANKFTDSANWCDANFSGDVGVDGSDFNIWNANKFTSSFRVAPLADLEEVAAAEALDSEVVPASPLISREDSLPIVAAPPAVVVSAYADNFTSVRDSKEAAEKEHAVEDAFARIAEWL